MIVRLVKFWCEPESAPMSIRLRRGGGKLWRGLCLASLCEFEVKAYLKAGTGGLSDGIYAVQGEPLYSRELAYLTNFKDHLLFSISQSRT